MSTYEPIAQQIICEVTDDGLDFICTLIMFLIHRPTDKATNIHAMSSSQYPGTLKIGGG